MFYLVFRMYKNFKNEVSYRHLSIGFRMIILKEDSRSQLSFHFFNLIQQRRKHPPFFNNFIKFLWIQKISRKQLLKLIQKIKLTKRNYLFPFLSTSITLNPLFSILFFESFLSATTTITMLSGKRYFFA